MSQLISRECCKLGQNQKKVRKELQYLRDSENAKALMCDEVEIRVRKMKKENMPKQKSL